MRSKDRTFGKFSPEHTLAACSRLEVTHKGLEKNRLPEPKPAHNTQFISTFRVPFTVLRYEGAEFWCFSLADLSVGVQTAARAPICPLRCRCSQVTRRKVSLADGQGRTERRTQVNRQEQVLLFSYFLMLPVDQSAKVLPRQRYLPLDRLCTTLTSVLHTSIPLKNLQKTEWRRCGRSRFDAQVCDGITKTLREKAKNSNRAKTLSAYLILSPTQAWRNCFVASLPRLCNCAIRKDALRTFSGNFKRNLQNTQTAPLAAVCTPTLKLGHRTTNKKCH